VASGNQSRTSKGRSSVLKRIYTVILILTCVTLMTCEVIVGEQDILMCTWKTVSGDMVNAKYIELK